MTDEDRANPMEAGKAAHDALMNASYTPTFKAKIAGPTMFIHSKDRTRCIRAEMTDDLHQIVWFGHLPHGSVPENGVTVIDMNEADAIEWAKAERKATAPVAAPYENPFRLK